MTATPTTIHHQGKIDIPVKLALNSFPESITILVGFSEPERAPLQWLNSYPSLAIAVRITFVPTMYLSAG